MFSNLFLSEDGYPHLPRKHQMQTFIGTKIIKARPMSRGDYNEYRSWAIPSDEVGTDEGYLVEYTDGGYYMYNRFRPGVRISINIL